MCEEKEARGAGGGRVVPWSVFPQVLCYPLLKLEPCGNKHSGVFYVQCMEGEVRRQIARKIKHKRYFAALFMTSPRKQTLV